MEWLTKLEHRVLDWLTKIPHLPLVARQWLGRNIWWIVLIGAILSAFGVLFTLVDILRQVAVLGTPEANYFVSPNYVAWVIITDIVAFVFGAIETVLLGLAVTPLRLLQKKGWVLLFMNWLVNGISVVITALLTLTIFGFITGILFGAVWLAISGYFLFEVHGQFAHVERSKGVRSAKK